MLFYKAVIALCKYVWAQKCQIIFQFPIGQTGIYDSWTPYKTIKEFVRNKAKGQISKRVFQENKARQIFRKMNISYLLIHTRKFAYQEVRNTRFSENLFLKHPFWDSPFFLITDGSETFLELDRKSAAIMDKIKIKWTL